MHWHPNADEWQYWIKGKGRMTVFDAGPQAQTADFNAGEVGYVKVQQGHIIQNTGTEDLILLAAFKTDEYQEISLSDWLTHTPPALVAQHFNIPVSKLAKCPADQPGIMPK
jgi:oxalate decarboxylase